MASGLVCLALDSVTRDLRFVNKQTLLLQHYVDFEESVPDLNGLTNSLHNVKRSFNRLLSCVGGNGGEGADNLHDLISHYTRNEVEYMLMNYVQSCTEEKRPDFDYIFIKTCAYMLQNVKYMKFKHYAQYLKNFKGNHVETFVHIVDLFVRPNTLCWNYLLSRIRKMLVLCEKIDIALTIFKDSYNIVDGVASGNDNDDI
ncbi:ac114-like protein [Alphabaculovirus altersperidaniae]|uniref:Ac114-like protein n=1 Tax=Spodoptera eridania nucleopolyhedrovirus TaxID=2315721 RepID=A0ABX6TV70_9ABAC|nr:ac114-like protein [Spodoptera eridania nucleopolyhedrovirus]QNV47837.1 ac114-like protein [Spodoptera eridania nucleopolyhedrovirus]